MANENLRQALKRADLEPEQLADLVGVDARSIRRWLAGGAPYARHRHKLARALGTTEQQLWPELADPADAVGNPTPGPAQTEPAATDDHGGDTDDTSASDGDRAADTPAGPPTGELIEGARERIYLHEDARQGLLDWPGLARLLVAKASRGCRVRILVCSPDPAIIAPLLAADGIEIRQTTGEHHPATQLIDDDDVVAEVRISTQADQPPITLHTTAERHPSVFTRLAQHYEHVWEHGQPLEAQRDSKPVIDVRGGDAPGRDGHEPPRAQATQPIDDDQAAQPVTPQPATAVARPAPAPRRWPGRRA